MVPIVGGILSASGTEDLGTAHPNMIDAVAKLTCVLILGSGVHALRAAFNTRRVWSVILASSFVIVFVGFYYLRYIDRPLTDIYFSISILAVAVATLLASASFRVYMSAAAKPAQDS